MPNPDPQSPPTTVLVVDDEDGIRQALDRFLTRLGYRVLQAASGAEALDRQAAEQPQVMLSDIRMPNMTGGGLGGGGGRGEKPGKGPRPPPPRGRGEAREGGGGAGGGGLGFL